MTIKELIERLTALSKEVGEEKDVYVQSYDPNGVLCHFDIEGAIIGNESKEIELEISNFD